jgi:hypothetical protein
VKSLLAARHFISASPGFRPHSHTIRVNMVLVNSTPSALSEDCAGNAMPLALHATLIERAS